MQNGVSGYYQCKPESKVNVCVSHQDFKAQVYNKENLEEAHRQLLKIIDCVNDPLLLMCNKVEN